MRKILKVCGMLVKGYLILDVLFLSVLGAGCLEAACLRKNIDLRTKEGRKNYSLICGKL